MCILRIYVHNILDVLVRIYILKYTFPSISIICMCNNIHKSLTQALIRIVDTYNMYS